MQNTLFQQSMNGYYIYYPMVMQYQPNLVNIPINAYLSSEGLSNPLGQNYSKTTKNLVVVSKLLNKHEEIANYDDSTEKKTKTTTNLLNKI